MPSWTGRARVHTAGPQAWVEVDAKILEAYEIRDLLEKSKGWATITITKPKRRRTTGPRSQNNAAWGYLRQIAMATGATLSEVEAACKWHGLDQGTYPAVEVVGGWAPKAQDDLTVEEAAAWIDTIQRVAAEYGITLKEDNE